MNQASSSHTARHGLGQLHARSVAPTNRRRMRQWRRQFVQSGRNEQLETALQTIASLHESDISPRRGLWTLRKIHQHVRPMLDEFFRNLREQSLPLPRKTQAKLGNYLAVGEELAGCYARLAYQEAERRHPSHKRLVQSLHASFEVQRDVLLIATQVYTEPPPGFWGNVHRAYRTAEEAGAAEMVVRPTGATRGARPESVSAVYRQILAFAVAETQSLPQSQLASVCEQLSNWVIPQGLGSQPPSQDPARLLISVDINSDSAPVFIDSHYAARQMSALAEGVRFMELTGIIAGLERLVYAEWAGGTIVDSSNALRPVTVEHLLRRFRTLHERKTSREPGMVRMEVKSGIEEIQSSLSYVVTEEEDAPLVPAVNMQHEKADAHSSLFETVEHHTSTPGAAPDNNEDGLVVDLPGRRHGDRRSATGATRSTRRSIEDTPVWTLVDESPRGLRVKCTINRPSRIRVGQVIAYQSRDDSGAATAWRLATVRWMRCPGASVFEFGAEKIEGHPYPAVVRRPSSNSDRKGNAGREETDPALVVHRGSAGKSSVIVPPHRYNSGEVVDLDLGALSLRVELTSVGIGNANYTQFHYRPQKARARQRAATV